MTDFIFLGSKITANGECSHEIKRHFFLGIKAMTNLDSVLRNRDITLPTKLHLVKAMVFPVVMYGYESWTTLKEGWVPRNRCSWTVMLEKTLESPLDCKENKPVNPKGNQPWIFTGRTDAESPTLWPPEMKSWLIGKTLMLVQTEGKRRTGWQRMRWFDNIIDLMDMNLSKLQEIVKDREAWCAAVHGVAKGWTWLSHWTIPLQGLTCFKFHSRFGWDRTTQ